MEATKNITAKEREFIAAVEAHRNAEGKVIAWYICANGNGKVIFENATKDRYSCAHVIDMDGGYFLLFVGERAGHPYDRKTYKRKGNALKGFKMQEGHNEPPTFATTPTETPQISTETSETVNVSVAGEKGVETQEMPRFKCPNYADYAFERGWHIENTDFDPHSGVLCMIHFDPSDEKYVCGCLWQINSDKPSYTEHRRFKTLKGAQNYGTKRMGMKLKYQTLAVNYPPTPTEPPQSPETPQTVECTAEPCKLAQTA